MRLKVEKNMGSWKVSNYLFSRQSSLGSLNKVFGFGSSILNRSYFVIGIQKQNVTDQFTQYFRLKALDFIFGSLWYGSSLKNFEQSRQKSLRSLGTVRSFRFFKKLPLRGQRTKTNAKTAKRR